MWIAASFGFLMPAVIPEKYRTPGDPRIMQVRARRSKDLDILRAEYMKGTLGPTIHTPDKDYEYRSYCTPEAFAFAVAEMIRGIDYAKFKPTTDRYGDDELHNVYTSMWGVLLRGLSTSRHQWEYWHEHPDGRRYAAQSRAKPNPKALGCADADFAEEYERLQGWLRDADLREHAAKHRDTSAGRDEAARVPDVIDVEWDADDTARRPSALEVVDRIQDEIDAVLDGVKATGPIDHSKCRHRQVPNAKAKCRARTRAAAQRQIRKLRSEMERAFRDAEADFSAEDADPQTWTGYPWERPRPSAQGSSYALS